MIRPTTRRYRPPRRLGWLAESRQSFLGNFLVWRLGVVSPLWSGHYRVPDVGASNGQPHGWPLPVRRQSAWTLVPRGYRRTARGRCGSLFLYRDGLPPPTPCRSPGALPLLRAKVSTPTIQATKNNERRCRSVCKRSASLFYMATGKFTFVSLA